MQVRNSVAGSSENLEAQKKLRDEVARREHIDYSINHVGNLLFGSENGSKMLSYVRAAGQPLVDDWDCLKTLVILLYTLCRVTYETKHNTHHIAQNLYHYFPTPILCLI